MAGMEGMVRLGRVNMEGRWGIFMLGKPGILGKLGKLGMLGMLGKCVLMLYQSFLIVTVHPSPTGRGGIGIAGIDRARIGRLRPCQRAFPVSSTFCLQLLLHTIASNEMAATPARKS